MISLTISRKLQVSARSSIQCVRYLSTDRPGPPKRPPNAFILYSIEQRPKLQSQHPGLAITKISKLLGQSYQQLSENEKDVYKTRSKQRMEEYERQMQEYESELTPQQQQDMKQDRVNAITERATRRQKRAIRKMEIETGKPKGPANAYSLFIKEKFKDGPTFTGSEDFLTYSRQNASEWKELSDERKQRYKDEAERLRVKYAEELEQYEAAMIEQGRLDMVSFNHLPQEEQKRVAAQNKIKKEQNKLDELKKLSIEMGKPQKSDYGGLTGFAVYAIEMSGQGYTLPRLQEKYHSLSEKDKQEFIDNAAVNKGEYEEMLAAWEADMMEQQMWQLVRKATLPTHIKNQLSPKKKAKKRGKKASTKASTDKTQEDPSWMREE